MVNPIAAQPHVPGAIAGHEKTESRKPEERHTADSAATAAHDAAVHPAPLPAESSSNARVQLSVDAQLRESIIQVVDPDTGKVLLQIPPEKALRQQRAYLEAQKSAQLKGKSEIV